MKTSKTFISNIYVGMKEITDVKIKEQSLSRQKRDAKKICKDYCDQVGLCVTFTETTFVYSGGEEAGLIIGLIQYPRFPKTETKIKFHALQIAKECMKILRQKRISIVHTDETIMIERADIENLASIFGDCEDENSVPTILKTEDRNYGRELEEAVEQQISDDVDSDLGYITPAVEILPKEKRDGYEPWRVKL